MESHSSISHVFHETVITITIGFKFISYFITIAFFNSSLNLIYLKTIFLLFALFHGTVINITVVFKFITYFIYSLKIPVVS